MLPALCWQPPAAWSRHLLLTQVSLASDFMWNLNSREASASFGYDYILRQCRLRGRIDTGALHALVARGARVFERVRIAVCFECCNRPAKLA